MRRCPARRSAARITIVASDPAASTSGRRRSRPRRGPGAAVWWSRRSGRGGRSQRSRLKVKVPSGLHVHVGNAAAAAPAGAAHSCCVGNSAALVACPGSACPGSAASASAPGAAGPGPARRLVKGLGALGGPLGGPLGPKQAKGRPGGWLLSRANCPCSDNAKCPTESCFMFMFRNRRNTLAKRLWNARVLQRPDRPEQRDADERGLAGGPAGASLKHAVQHAVLRNSFLKRLKEPQMETLLQAVESRGSSLTSCVVLERDAAGGAQPHLLCCQIWRWPELVQGSELRPLPMCSAGANASTICCNPYHWSRLCRPESPPPPYGRLPEKRLKPEDCAPSEIGQEAVAEDPLSEPDVSCKQDAAWGRTPPRWQDWQSWQGSFSTNGEGGAGSWCQLKYWELADRVGRLYEVQNPYINVSSAAEPANQGLCLATLAQNAPGRPPGSALARAVERTRAKIGLGVTLSQEADGVWAYNRSDHPIFVNSPTLDDPESRTLLVYRVPPGHCLNIFRADTTSQHWERWRRCNELAQSGPVDPGAVRISFAKGWGPKYSRQEVTACPCWLEVLLSPCR